MVVATPDAGADAPAQSILAAIDVRHRDGEMGLAIRRCFETNLGSRLRASEVSRLLLPSACQTHTEMD
jgi:hypothetical protein